MVGTGGRPGGASIGAYLYTLNTATGVASRVGNTARGFDASENDPRGLAAIGSTLYMVGWENSVLYTLDTSTGAATRVGSTPAGFNVSETLVYALAALGNRLYILGRSGSPAGAPTGAYLYTLNTATGVASRVGMTTSGFGVNESRPSGLASTAWLPISTKVC